MSSFEEEAIFHLLLQRERKSSFVIKEDANRAAMARVLVGYGHVCA
jgi:hypothetical protein